MQRAVGERSAAPERPAEPQPAALAGLRHPAAHVPQAEGAALPASAHHGSQVGRDEALASFPRWCRELASKELCFTTGDPLWLPT